MMDDDEDLYFCGTSLPDPEDGPSAQKPTNRELQVRDEKGHQHFHGAFTGGFSAGYFNTVGTKEGWAPSTFVSSRSRQAECVGQQQHPEDFMDSEGSWYLNWKETGTLNLGENVWNQLGQLPSVLPRHHIGADCELSVEHRETKG